MAFRILTRCFVQCPLYLFKCTPPFSTFIKSLISFDSSFHKVFGRLLDPGSFNSLKRLLTHKQSSFPITFSGIKLILTSTITPITYLRSWAHVVSIIVVKFMVNQHPFFLEALARVDNNTFPFQQHISFLATLQGNMWYSTTPNSCMCSSIWTTHRGNKWFNFKIPFWNICTIIPFLACFSTGHLKPIMPEFYHVLA